MHNRPLSPAQIAWVRSARFRAIGSAAIRAYNAERFAGPRCGAKARTTGEPCRNPAGPNGRCYVHGGRTPKGENWHRPRWPEKDHPRALAKATAKVKDHERAAQRRAARLAAMTPDERARHDAWKRSHRPGPPAERARARAERQQAAEVRKVMDRLPDPPSAETIALQRHLDELRREAERLLAQRTDEPKPLGAFD